MTATMTVTGTAPIAPTIGDKTSRAHRPRQSASVWDDLWRNPKLEHQEETTLLREQRGPRWRIIQHAIQTRLGAPQGLKTIELGSGRGDLSALLALQGAQPTLVDNSRPALDAAKRRFQRLHGKARFVQDDLFNCKDTLSNKYDISMSLGVIEHFRGVHRNRILRAHRDVLKKGGICVIGVPNAACPPYRLWKLCLESIKWWPYGMEIPYTRKELRRRASEAGFDRIEIHCTGFWQSVSDFWIRGMLHGHADWIEKTSVFDNWWGANLLLIARKPLTAE